MQFLVQNEDNRFKIGSVKDPFTEISVIFQQEIGPFNIVQQDI
jgi:hypothetical protein